MQLNETRWGKWLRETTGGSSTREIAERIGPLRGRGTVSHTTVQRWSKNGIPPEVVFELALRYQVDICAAVIQQGWVSIDEVRSANMDFLVQQIPTGKLTGELHRRTMESETPKLERQPARPRLMEGPHYTECRMSARQTPSTN